MLVFHLQFHKLQLHPKHPYHQQQFQRPHDGHPTTVLPPTYSYHCTNHYSSNEELWSICVFTGIGHWYNALSVMFDNKWLILKAGTINALPARSCSFCKIALHQNQWSSILPEPWNGEWYGGKWNSYSTVVCPFHQYHILLCKVLWNSSLL